MTHTIDESTYAQYLAALLAGNRAECARIVQEMVAAGTKAKHLYVGLFQRSQYRVGELWASQHISVAVEHLATAITERMLTLVHPQVFGGPARDRSIIIACVAAEYHQLGSRMIADFCEMRAWRAPFLGANTSLADLLQLIEERRPDVLGLSLSAYFNLPSLLKTLDAVSAKYPDLPILAGGQAFRWGAQAALEPYPNVKHIETPDELEQFLAAYEH